MKCFLAALFSLLILAAASAVPTVYAFQVTNWPAPAVGYLDTAVGHGQGFGAMYLGGYRWPLCGFDSWWHGGVASPGWHMCLLIHPERPWIVGTALWRGTQGKIDLLSADLIWYELSITVTEIATGQDFEKGCY
jgi:hypothetical protein